MQIALLALPINFDPNVSVVIATFASIGFALFLAIPAILTAAQPVIERRAREARPKEHRDYLLNELSKETTIDGFLYDAVIFIASGVFDVLYVGIGQLTLLFIAWIVLITALVLVVLDMLGLALLVSYFIPKWKKELQEFKAQTEAHLPRVRRVRCNVSGCRRLFKTKRGLSMHRSRAHAGGNRTGGDSGTNPPAQPAAQSQPGSQSQPVSTSGA